MDVLWPSFYLESRSGQLSANVGTYQVDVVVLALVDSSLDGLMSRRTFPPASPLALRSPLRLLIRWHLCLTLSLNVAFPAFLPRPCLFIPFIFVDWFAFALVHMCSPHHRVVWECGLHTLHYCQPCTLARRRVS